ncbi:hypothetical protein D3C78_1244850 [compost metagenome]
MQIPSAPACWYCRVRLMISCTGRIPAWVRAMIAISESQRASSAARILPTPSATVIRSVDLRPNCAGSRVSSMVSAATPARSSSTMVRMTLSALP